MPTCGEQLMSLLTSYGVDTVFGIPGVHTLELYRGLAKSGIRHIGVRHEQGAGHATGDVDEGQVGQFAIGAIETRRELRRELEYQARALRRDLAANATALARFQAESKTNAQLSHANIVQAYMVGEHEGRH